MTRMGFDPIELSPQERELVREVRAFARVEPFPPSAESPTRGGFSREFSAELGRRGWVGMNIPAEYGGSARTGVQRSLVISELLAAGAPLGAHWTADRQTAPSLLMNGPESLRRCLLPEIAAGACLMAGGLSEPEAGSDLASVRTRARRVDGGWRITGRKIWTTDADRADYIEILCRTSDAERKHDGLSLIVVPMDAEGLTVHPIEGMDGGRHFNEVVIDDVFAPEDWLIGEEGSGWRQLTAELALERAGPERYLSTFPLFESFVASRNHVADPGRAFELIGNVIAQQTGLRQMSLSIARMVEQGASPVAEAAMAKDLGTELEQLLVDQLWPYRYEIAEPGPAVTRFHEFLDINRLRSAVFTIAGGTNEVLRLLVSRQLGAWAATRKGWVVRSQLAETAYDLATQIGADAALRSVPQGKVDPVSSQLVPELAKAGFLGVGVAEGDGGSGGTLADALEIIRGAAYAGASIPVLDGSITAGWLLAAAGIHFPWSDELAVLGNGMLTTSGDRLVGTLGSIAWAGHASTVVVPVDRDGQLHVATISMADLGLDPGAANTAGEPVVRGVAVDVTLPTLVATSVAYADAAETLARRTALARAVALAAALQRVGELTIEYAGQRVQFGQPINRFQAVQTHLTRLASEAQRVAVLVDAAQAQLGESDDRAPDFALVATARTLAGEAAMVAGRTAHQVHGAIGVTMEYALQRYTRRLWEWAVADGGSDRWARALGERAVAEPLGAWQLITGISHDSRSGSANERKWSS
jgi:alkylation response protein AidB-like acyl-CoA dehydrogenase